MSGSEKRVDIRIPEVEFQLLEDYCKLTGRTKTDVLRDLIRSLKRKLPKSPGLPG
jgi:predicted DNA-binding protein